MNAQADRSLSIAAYAICKTNGCKRYGTDRNGSTGCLCLSKPCSLLDRLYESVRCPQGYFHVVPIGDGHNKQLVITDE